MLEDTNVIKKLDLPNTQTLDGVIEDFNTTTVWAKVLVDGTVELLEFPRNLILEQVAVGTLFTLTVTPSTVEFKLRTDCWTTEHLDTAKLKAGELSSYFADGFNEDFHGYVVTWLHG